MPYADLALRRLALFSFLVSICLRSASASKDSVPDWVRNAAQQMVPAYTPTTNAVNLLDETTCTVFFDGHAIEHHRRVIKILRSGGRQDATVVVPFDKDTKLLALHVWSIGPDGHEYAVKDSEALEFSYDGSGVLYADMGYKVVNAPGRDPGGVIAYEYEQRLPSYMKEEDWIFQGSTPSLQQRFTLKLPPGYTFGSVWAHHKPIDMVHLEGQRWEWELKDIPGINLHNVSMAPREGALAGRLAIHFEAPEQTTAVGGTWQSIGLWYQQLSIDRLAASPEIAAKAKELTAGKTDFYDKTEAIAEFVQQQIRNFVIKKKKIEGLQPHAANEILKDRYGDCKDKTALLSAMLSTIGIHSAFVMVNTERGFIDPNAPSLMGNHVIAGIEIPAGYESSKFKSVVAANTGRRYLIFDPTWEKTAFGQLEHNLQGSYGILVEGKDSQIIQLPVLCPELNTIQRSASFQVQADGSLKGNVTEKRFGDLSEHRRYVYTSGDKKKQDEFLDRVIQQDFTSYKVSDIKVENAESLNKPLVTTYSLDASYFGKKMGPLLMVRPRVLGREAPELNHEPRLVPIDLSQTMQVQDDYSIELPEEYVVDEIPQPVKIDLGFAAYQSMSKIDGKKLHYTRTYTVRELTLPAERYEDLQKLAAVISADEQSSAVLKKQ